VQSAEPSTGKRSLHSLGICSDRVVEEVVGFCGDGVLLVAEGLVRESSVCYNGDRCEACACGGACHVAVDIRCVPREVFFFFLPWRRYCFPGRP
jgi:hypothetical protein